MYDRVNCLWKMVVLRHTVHCSLKCIEGEHCFHRAQVYKAVQFTNCRDLLSIYQLNTLNHLPCSYSKLFCSHQFTEKKLCDASLSKRQSEDFPLTKVFNYVNNSLRTMTMAYCSRVLGYHPLLSCAGEALGFDVVSLKAGGCMDEVCA